jgi:hypothetical protein
VARQRRKRRLCRMGKQSLCVMRLNGTECGFLYTQILLLKTLDSRMRKNRMRVPEVASTPVCSHQSLLNLPRSSRLYIRTVTDVRWKKKYRTISEVNVDKQLHIDIAHSGLHTAVRPTVSLRYLLFPSFTGTWNVEAHESGEQWANHMCRRGCATCMGASISQA